MDLILQMIRFAEALRNLDAAQVWIDRAREDYTDDSVFQLILDAQQDRVNRRRNFIYLVMQDIARNN